MKHLIACALVVVAACGSGSPSPKRTPEPAAPPAPDSVATPTAEPAAVTPAARPANPNPSGKPNPTSCALGRDAWLAAAEVRIDEIIAGSPPDQRAEVRVQADGEQKAVRDGFVTACMGMALYDVACFTDPALIRTAYCRTMEEQIIRPLLP